MGVRGDVVRPGTVFYPVPKGSQLANPARREKRLLMRRLKLSSRQFRRFRKHMRRVARRPELADMVKGG